MSCTYATVIKFYVYAFRSLPLHTCDLDCAQIYVDNDSMNKLQRQLQNVEL